LTAAGDELIVRGAAHRIRETYVSSVGASGDEPPRCAPGLHVLRDAETPGDAAAVAVGKSAIVEDLCRDASNSRDAFDLVVKVDPAVEIFER